MRFVGRVISSQTGTSRMKGRSKRDTKGIPFPGSTCKLFREESCTERPFEMRDSSRGILVAEQWSAANEAHHFLSILGARRADGVYRRIRPLRHSVLEPCADHLGYSRLLLWVRESRDFYAVLARRGAPCRRPRSNRAVCRLGGAGHGDDRPPQRRAEETLHPQESLSDGPGDDLVAVCPPLHGGVSAGEVQKGHLRGIG